jgi:hypothetical protein
LAKKKDRYIVGLDIGTHKICAIVAEITPPARRQGFPPARAGSIPARAEMNELPCRGRSMSETRGNSLG